MYLHLGCNNQDISLGDMFRAGKGGFESSRAKSHIDEWIRRQNEDQQLRGPCDMMIDETSPCCLVHLRVYLAIGLLEQEAFKDVKTDYKVVDEDDADDQGTEWCQSGNGL